MLETIRRLRSGPETSASLRTALAEVKAAVPAAEHKLREANSTRTALLMTGTTRQIRDAEDALRDAGIELDRLEVALTDLTRRLSETEISEAKAALDRERADVDARATKLSATAQDRYDRAAAPLVELLVEIASTDDAVAAINKKLHSAGRFDFLQPVEERSTWWAPGRIYAAVSLRALTSVRASRAQPGWGAGSEVIEKLGRKP